MPAEATACNGEVKAATPDLQREMAQCRAEVAAVEALLRAGHPDVAGLCLALSDWSAELRILERERERSSISDSDPHNRAGVRTDRDVRQPPESGAARRGA
jgi:hypothetical protein